MKGSRSRRLQPLVALVAAAIACRAAPAPATQQPRVQPGIDVLLSDSIGLISGKRVGLITNQSGIDSRGISTIDRLFALSSGPRSTVNGPRLVMLFAPEHGIRGGAAPGATINDSTDAATGLPIFSLYGTNRAPTAAQLSGLDVLVVDLQDVGSRTWTYVSTTVLAMRAAKASGKRIIVLDRPNPIGCAMSGPVLDTVNASFIGMLPVPLRHGLTMGELARFANAELRIGADLVVVPVKGWRRCMWFDETGLPWVRPSPNLPDLEAAAWYPGTVLFEATDLSVGRGTDAPFTQFGAPWLAEDAFTSWRTAVGQPVTFTPRAPGDAKFDGVMVAGVRLARLDRGRTDPVHEAVQAIRSLQAIPGSRLRVDSLGMARRLGVPLSSYRPENDSAAISAFRSRVIPYLLYP